MGPAVVAPPMAALAALLAPEKEAAVLFVFFGYYPMLRKLIGRLRVRAAAWVVSSCMSMRRSLRPMA